MATVQLGNAFPVDMRLQQVFYGTARIATSSQIEIVYGNYVADYYGQGFAYSSSGDVVGGTLTGFSETFNGRSVYSAIGLNVPATLTYQLVQSGNPVQLVATALSGNDTITGAGNNDVLVGYGGNNSFIGVSSGTDNVAYSGSSSAYSVVRTSQGFSVTRPDGGVDTLKDIKSILFTDKTVPLTSSSGVGSTNASDFQVISARAIGLYRFFSKTDGTHFFTASTSEQQQVAASRSDLTFEGTGLSAVNPANLSSDPQARAVFRFFDSVYGTHFYTISQSEQQAIVATRSDLKYEGTALYADASKVAGDSAVYRFFDTGNGTHFYTSSSSEVAQIQSARPDLKNEGVAFYVPTT